MNPYQKILFQIPDLEERLGYVFQKKELLALAFVHRSFFNENRKEVSSYNERLEFLGDSILGLLISEYLYARFPEEPEGQLSHLKANLIEATMCAKLIKKLGLTESILLGKGELINKGQQKESIQADLFEALLGAIYLDGGLESAKIFFWKHFQEEVELSLRHPLPNWKAEIQDHFQKNHQKLPVYNLLSEHGPDHHKVFEIGVFFEGELLGRGLGHSKKEAEQLAAREAIEYLFKGKRG